MFRMLVWGTMPHRWTIRRSPRSFLYRGRQWVEDDLYDRERQWSNEGKPPRGLAHDSFAFQHGPPGRNEVVIYFDLCREVVAQAWRKLVEVPHTGETDLAAALYEHAQRWLKEGSIDGDPTPPAAMIMSERQRMPLTGNPSILDDECPICRMLANDSEGAFGPMFCNFDGHHLELDDEFAFSLCETREEWEREQGENRGMADGIEAKRRLESAEEAAPEFASAWTSSYVADEAPLTAMTLAFRLSEIVSDLQVAEAPRDQIRNLNDAFESCRSASYDRSLLLSAKPLLVSALEAIAASHPRLMPKVAEFQSEFDDWIRRRSDSDSVL